LADHFGRTLAEIAPSIAASVQPVLDEVHRSGVAASDRELHVDVDGEERVVVASFFPIATETETHYVLRLLAEGGSYAEIGSTLFLSPGTVRAQAQRAMTKLGARTRTQAVAVALRDAVIG
jgi:DNA-binding NarL/FixJ family response regulator